MISLLYMLVSIYSTLLALHFIFPLKNSVTNNFKRIIYDILFTLLVNDDLEKMLEEINQKIAEATDPEEQCKWGMLKIALLKHRELK